MPRSTGFHLRTAFVAESSSDPSDHASLLAYPISFKQLGRNSGIVTYYVDSASIRAQWCKKLTQAYEARMRRVAEQKVVQLNLLCDATFGAATFGSLTPAPSSSQFGRPTCSVPLVSADGQQLIAIGSPEGLFIGFRGRAKSMRQVLHLPDITQCAVLQEFGFFLVVAGRILIAYPIEALIPSSSATVDTISKAPQKLSGQKDVLFFRVGKVGDASHPRTLVIYVKRSGVKEAVFKALEPVAISDRSAGTAHRFLGFGGAKSDSFKTYKVSLF